MIGEFNEALWQHEHFSATPRPERQMMDFREVLSHCDLHDIGFRGLPWTYNNNQGGQRNVRVRLDRGVANSDWSLLFPEAMVTHIDSSRSDHKALLLQCSGDVSNNRPPKIFRYEIMWERAEGLQMQIEQAWLRRNPGSDLGCVAASLKQMSMALGVWSRANFGHVRKKIEELRQKLATLERDGPVSNRDQIFLVKRELDEVLYREEMMWLQRSRITWLKEGDRNTKLFHRKAIWRAKKN